MRYSWSSHGVRTFCKLGDRLLEFCWLSRLRKVLLVGLIRLLLVAVREAICRTPHTRLDTSQFLLLQLACKSGVCICLGLMERLG